MRHVSIILKLILVWVLVFSLVSCAKKKEDCKVCTARASLSSPVLEESNVCTPDEETQFLARHRDVLVNCQ
jgi:hypothetical protein